ncbi:MAG TPA: glutaredoxin family protein [Pyrinomonadaceae bacterium]|jgi:glutaredoxin
MPSESEIKDETTRKATVTLYVVPGCPLCARARAWLERRGVAYLERDVANDFGALRAMHRLTRQRLVPVFVAQGRALVRPSEDELAELLR